MSKAEPKPKVEVRNQKSRPLYRHSTASFPSQTRDASADEEALWNDGDTVAALREGPPPSRPANLLERTAKFGESVIRFARSVPKSINDDPLINQFVRAGTSVGANYCEADDPLSRKDYLKSIGICRKESKETKYWLRMIATAEPALREAARPLWQEAKELNLIFGAIFRKK